MRFIHPSPAERFHLDLQQRLRDQEARSQQAAHRAHLAHIARQSQPRLTGGPSLNYTEHRIDIGDVSYPGDGQLTTIALPFDFGTALSLIVHVEAARRTAGSAPLWVSLCWALRPDDWFFINRLNATNPYLTIRDETLRNGARYLGPFANRLGMTFHTQHGSPQSPGKVEAGAWEGVSVLFGVQSA